MLAKKKQERKPNDYGCFFVTQKMILTERFPHSHNFFFIYIFFCFSDVPPFSPIAMVLILSILMISRYLLLSKSNSSHNFFFF